MSMRIRVMPKPMSFDRPRIKYMLRLMMVVDAMRSSYAWVSHVFETTPKTQARDRLWALVVSIGQAGEAIRVIKDGANQKFVNRAMIESATERRDALLRTWDDCFAQRPPRLICAMHRIRDRYFAHWDDDCEAVEPFLRSQSQMREPLPILEIDADQSFLTAHYPWASEAISADIVRHTGLDPGGSAIGEIAEYVATILNTAEQLVTAIASEEGIRASGVDPGPNRANGSGIS